MDSVNGLEDEYGSTDVSDYTSVDHISNSESASFAGTDADDDPLFSLLSSPSFGLSAYEWNRSFSFSSYYSIHSFVEDMQAAGLRWEAPGSIQKLWVFRREDISRDHFPHPSSTSPGDLTDGDPVTIQDKIQKALSNFDLSCEGSYANSLLVQFWAPNKAGDQNFLTTSDQPFGLSHIHKGLCRYRIQCQKYQFNVDEESNPSLPGRVFRYKWPECTPDVRCYSIQQHPLCVDAESGEIRNSLALPIYEKSPRSCIGVLELVDTSIKELQCVNLMKIVHTALETAGLESTRMYYGYDGINNHKIGGSLSQELEEIQRVLKEAGTRKELLLAQTWVTCEHEKVLDSTGAEDLLFRLKKLHYENRTFEISRFRKLTAGLPMRKCHGLVGKALSARKPIFCKDVTKFGISDYPLVHYARSCHLASCFAILLLSTCSPSESYYIIELFLRPCDKDNGVPRTILNWILLMMRQELQFLKVSSPEEQGGGFSFEVIMPYRNDECTASTMHQTGTLPSVNGMQVEDYVSRPSELIGESVLRMDKKNVDGPDQTSVVVAKSREGPHAASLEGELENNNEISFSYEVLQQQFGKKLKDAAKYFGVSPSTLKRVSREHGISRWPSYKRKKGGCSPPNTHAKRFVRTSQKHLAEPINKVSSYPDILPSEGTATQSANSVTIKATYDDDTIKFSFSLTSGLENLVENVTKRLNLDAGTFKLKYRDNENDLILIACDDDLRACINCSRPFDESTIRILVLPMKTQAPESHY